MDFIKEKLSGQSGGRILDIATQEGGFIVKLVDMFGSFDDAVGVDVDDKWLDKARQKFEGKPFSFVKMDGADLKFDDNSFDTVAICVALHHLPDINKTLQEMKRVLKPGGRFVVREMFCDDQNDLQMSGILAHHWRAKIHRMNGISHNPTMGRQEILDLIDGVGLSDYESGEYLRQDVDYTLAEIIESETKSHAELLAGVKGDPAHDKLKRESDEILERLQKVGFAYPRQLDMVGRK